MCDSAFKEHLQFPFVISKLSGLQQMAGVTSYAWSTRPLAPSLSAELPQEKSGDGWKISLAHTQWRHAHRDQAMLGTGAGDGRRDSHIGGEENTQIGNAFWCTDGMSVPVCRKVLPIFQQPCDALHHRATILCEDVHAIQQKRAAARLRCKPVQRAKAKLFDAVVVDEPEQPPRLEHGAACAI
jgi:hypothetical protein